MHIYILLECIATNHRNGKRYSNSRNSSNSRGHQGRNELKIKAIMKKGKDVQRTAQKVQENTQSCLLSAFTPNIIGLLSTFGIVECNRKFISEKDAGH